MARAKLRLVHQTSPDGLDGDASSGQRDNSALRGQGAPSDAPTSQASPQQDLSADGEALAGRANSLDSGRLTKRAVLADLPDEALVALAVGADARAAEQLYRRHAAFAINLATRIAGSTNDVEDVVHDAFIKALDNLANLRNPKAFRGWLGSIVVHAMRSRLRRARFVRLFGLGRGGDPVDIEQIASSKASPRSRAQLAQVYALLRTLSVDERIAWTLRVVEGHELKTAAELAGCSLATIKRRIRRAQRYIDQHFVEAAPPSTRGDFATSDAPSPEGSE